MRYVIRYTVCSMLLMLPTALAAAATFNCQLPQFAPPERQGVIFDFTSSVTCQVSATGNHVAGIKTAYERHLRSHHTVRGAQTGAMLHGLAGIKLDVVEKVQTSFGEITTASEVYLVDNQRDKFVYADTMRQIIAATGNTQFTRARTIVAVADKLANGHYRVQITLKLSAKKPALAPQAFFISQVKNGVSSELKTLSRLLAQLVDQGLSTPPELSATAED